VRSGRVGQAGFGMTGRLASSSGAAQDEDPLEVPRHGHGAPLAPYLSEAAQEELAESEHGFDDAEHRFRHLLAKRLKLFPSGVFNQCTMAATGVGFSGAGGAGAKHSAGVQ